MKQVPAVDQAIFVRVVALDDIRIRKGGTGRTVEAYAAVFNEPAEVFDQDGHYLEQNAATAFNRTLANRKTPFPVIYNHGLSMAGTPSERGTVPIGVSKEVRVDGRGLLTISEYGTSELAEEVLESIRMGAISGQSYGGQFLRSTPRLPRSGYRAAYDGKLPLVTRQEIKMHEFGPTPVPAFAGAAIVGVRAMQMYQGLATPLDPSRDPAAQHADTPPEQGGPVEETEDPQRSQQHSVRSMPLATRIRLAKIARGME
jgi:HK97 family phage prohead protease